MPPKPGGSTPRRSHRGPCRPWARGSRRPAGRGEPPSRRPAPRTARRACALQSGRGRAAHARPRRPLRRVEAPPRRPRRHVPSYRRVGPCRRGGRVGGGLGLHLGLGTVGLSQVGTLAETLVDGCRSLFTDDVDVVADGRLLVSVRTPCLLSASGLQIARSTSAPSCRVSPADTTPAHPLPRAGHGAYPRIRGLYA